jgi:hypothetical protein
LKLKTGDWVVITGHYTKHYNGLMCEVADYNKGTGKYLVAPVAGQEIRGQTWLHKDFLAPAPLDLTEEDYKALNALYMDLALKTKDYNWCEELGGKKDGF